MDRQSTGEQYWEERIRRMTQMSQDVDDGLYDDVLIPMTEATDRLITSQMPDGYAYDLDECRFVRFNPNLPNSFAIKGEAGNDLPVPAPAIIHPTALEADPDRYETRTRPAPAAQPRTPAHTTPMDSQQVTAEQYWEKRIRRMTQMSQDVNDGLYDDVLAPIREASFQRLIAQMPDGYAYDNDECQVVRLDPSLPDRIVVTGEAGNDVPIVTHRIVPLAEAVADPERYETRTRPAPAAQPHTPAHTTPMDSQQVTAEQYWEERIRRMTQMSQDIDDGLYDDVLIPLREATDRLITSQMPDGYAYDLDECRFVRLDPHLPDAFTIKGEAGNDLPVPAPITIHPSEMEADPERYETRT